MIIGIIKVGHILCDMILETYRLGLSQYVCLFSPPSFFLLSSNSFFYKFFLFISGVLPAFLTDVLRVIIHNMVTALLEYLDHLVVFLYYRHNCDWLCKKGSYS